MRRKQRNENFENIIASLDLSKIIRRYRALIFYINWKCFLLRIREDCKKISMMGKIE